MEIAGARGVARENKKKLMGWEPVSEMTGSDFRLNMGAEEGEEGKRRTKRYPLIFGLNNIVNDNVVYKERLGEQSFCMSVLKALY